MADYRLSNAAKEDFIGIYHYGVEKFGILQADKYFDSLFKYFDLISQQPYAFESIEYIQRGYRLCACDAHSIYYGIKKNIVEIMAIVGSQDLKNAL